MTDGSGMFIRLYVLDLPTTTSVVAPLLSDIPCEGSLGQIFISIFII